MTGWSRSMFLCAGVPLVFGVLAGTAASQEAGDRPLITQVEYERWLTELSNWDRWGPDDEMGALNLITPAKRQAAAALVREGITVSLASTAELERTIANPCPIAWEMTSLGDRSSQSRWCSPWVSLVR